MRISKIEITQWRHFSNVELTLETETGLVCLVGPNGAGKSHLLELIAACAHRLGLSHGVDIPRGDPFGDPHEFSLKFFLAEGVSETTDQALQDVDGFDEWDRTLNLISHNNPNSSNTRVEAGGIADAANKVNFAKIVINKLHQAKEVHFLSLDADRAYPKKNINFNEVAQAYETDWEGIEFTKGKSYRPTSTLYDEWIKYFLAQENQSGTKLMQNMRRAKKQDAKPLEFEDHFEGYASSLRKVLPHIEFTGVNSKKRTLLFDTTGLEISFDQLSGGEREIAFLLGQIDRFKLQQGLFLLDEPELHLNADSIRNWVGYLISTVEFGQIWLATHSLEAVEATGQHATFVLERNEETRKVDSIARLDSRPVLSALSRAVGTPAFSISQMRFAFVEGEEHLGERERIRKLTGIPQNFRFIESGSCNDVLRRVEEISQLANEADIGIYIGGIVDRDFRTEQEINILENEKGLHVLLVHEIENFFIHPATLQTLLSQNGRPHLNAIEMIRNVADTRAGSWIFQFLMFTPNAANLPELPPPAKERAKGLSWDNLTLNFESSAQGVLDLSGYSDENRRTLKQLLHIGVAAYGRKREMEDFWKLCEGKQVLNSIARDIGFSGRASLEQAAFSVWDRKVIPLPQEIVALREYLENLPAR